MGVIITSRNGLHLWSTNKIQQKRGEKLKELRKQMESRRIFPRPYHQGRKSPNQFGDQYRKRIDRKENNEVKKKGTEKTPEPSCFIR